MSPRILHVSRAYCTYDDCTGLVCAVLKPHVGLERAAAGLGEATTMATAAHCFFFFQGGGSLRLLSSPLLSSSPPISSPSLLPSPLLSPYTHLFSLSLLPHRCVLCPSPPLLDPDSFRLHHQHRLNSRSYIRSERVRRAPSLSCACACVLSLALSPALSRARALSLSLLRARRLSLHLSRCWSAIPPRIPLLRASALSLSVRALSLSLSLCALCARLAVLRLENDVDCGGDVRGQDLHAEQACRLRDPSHAVADRGAVLCLPPLQRPLRPPGRPPQDVPGRGWKGGRPEVRAAPPMDPS